MEFSSYRNAYTTNVGYDIFGDETDDYNQNTHGSAPGNPVSNRLYIQDQIEYSDVVIKAGFSLNIGTLITWVQILMVMGKLTMQV